MKIINKDGFLFRVVKDDDPRMEDADTIDGNGVFPLIDFVYGYEHRGSQSPVLTVAVVPFLDGDELYYGIGLAYCSSLDQCVKASGRRIALSRAKASIEVGMDLHWKVYKQNEDSPRTCGIITDWENAPVNIERMQFSQNVTERLTNSFKFLARVIKPEIVNA